MSHPQLTAVAAVVSGALLGAVAGGSALALTPEHADAHVPASDAPSLVDGAHLPAVVTVPGDAVRLRYAIVCTPHPDGTPCDGAGEIHLRAGTTGAFRTLPLARGDDSRDGRYFVDVPAEIVSSPAGFSYYATLRDEATGAAVMIPSGGAEAPVVSRPLAGATRVTLDLHAFGRTRAPSARELTAAWGSADGQAGLAGSKEIGFLGPSAFDVLPSGRIVLLDQVNRRVTRWEGGRAVAATALDVDGLPADLAAEPDGSLYVLEPPARSRKLPIVRSFGDDGAVRWSQAIADRTASKLAHGPTGPVVQQQPSEQWRPVADGGHPLGRSAQARVGSVGRPLGHGRELVVARVGTNELRVALARGNGVEQGWIVTSTTPLGEVALADRYHGGALVVVKTYTDERDEYVALVLGAGGVVERFSITTDEWADAAPLARFRLAGSALYHLGSTPAAAFVDRFDLEHAR